MEVFDKDIGQDKRLGIKVKDKKDRGTITIKIFYHQFNKEEQLVALEAEKNIVEERKKLKEEGVIGTTMDVLDGAASAVGSSVGMVGTGVATGAGLVGIGIGAGAGLVGTEIGAGASLVGSGIGAGVGFVSSGLGAVGSGLSRARMFMGRTITGQANYCGSYNMAGGEHWLKQLNNVMQSGLSWNVGLGDKIKFWEDCWNGEGVVLMQKIPRLYQISRQQHNLIQQVGSFSDTSWEWNLTWRRQLFDNEADSAYKFMRELSQLVIQQVPDRWVWKHEPNGLYSTRREARIAEVHGKPGSQRYNRWKTWWIALTWSIWKHRNEVIFQNAQFNGIKLLEDAVFLHWTWLRAMEKDFSMHYNKWSSNLIDGLDQTYLREVAKEKKHKLLTILECDEHDAQS
ncbi:hypothetical protein HKD37_10G028305 [Glycine soja]